MQSYSFKFHIFSPSAYCLPQTDDDLGVDDTVCSLTYYYFGNVVDNSICGYFITPANIGQTTLYATLNGQSTAIGTLFAFLQFSGVLTTTIQLNCPWMMILDPNRAAALSISIRCVLRKSLFCASKLTACQNLRKCFLSGTRMQLLLDCVNEFSFAVYTVG